MPEEISNPASGTPPKTEIVAAIPVQEQAKSLIDSTSPTTNMSASQPPLKTADNLKPHQTPASLTPIVPKNHRLGIVIAIACLVAIGLSIAAAVAYKSTI